MENRVEEIEGPEIVIVADIAEAIAAIETLDDLQAFRATDYPLAEVTLPRGVRLDVWLMEVFRQRPIALVGMGLGLGLCLGFGGGFLARWLSAPKSRRWFG